MAKKRNSMAALLKEAEEKKKQKDENLLSEAFDFGDDEVETELNDDRVKKIIPEKALQKKAPESKRTKSEDIAEMAIAGSIEARDDENIIDKRKRKKAPERTTIFFDEDLLQALGMIKVMHKIPMTKFVNDNIREIIAKKYPEYLK